MSETCKSVAASVFPHGTACVWHDDAGLHVTVGIRGADAAHVADAIARITAAALTETYRDGAFLCAHTSGISSDRPACPCRQKPDPAPNS